MKHILSMYRMTKLVDERSKKFDRVMKNSGGQFKNDGKDVIIKPAEAFIKDEYVKRYRLTPRTEVIQACLDCVSNGYLKSGMNYDPMFEEGDPRKELPNLAVTEKGRNLIDTVPYLPFIPIGLWREWWSRYGNFLAGMGVASVSFGVISAFVKWVIPLIADLGN